VLKLNTNEASRALQVLKSFLHHPCRAFQVLTDHEGSFRTPVNTRNPRQHQRLSSTVTER
jgi:hypothetical protein